MSFFTPPVPIQYASFVKCYHGVNEGSLFPLRQGLFFMKPALFLPKGDIEQVFLVPVHGCSFEYSQG